MLLWDTVKSPSCKITFSSWLFFAVNTAEISQGSRLLLPGLG